METPSQTTRAAWPAVGEHRGGVLVAPVPHAAVAHGGDPPGRHHDHVVTRQRGLRAALRAVAVGVHRSAALRARRRRLLGGTACATGAAAAPPRAGPPRTPRRTCRPGARTHRQDGQSGASPAVPVTASSSAARRLPRRPGRSARPGRLSSRPAHGRSAPGRRATVARPPATRRSALPAADRTAGPRPARRCSTCAVTRIRWPGSMPATSMLAIAAASAGRPPPEASSASARCARASG